MILAVREWIDTKRDVFGPGEYSGARIAHSDLIKAALRYEVIQKLFLFQDIDDRHSGEPRSCDTAVELIEEFGTDRVEVRPLRNFANDIRKSECIVFSSGPMIASLAATRVGLDVRFPICSVLHGVRWDNLMATYMYTMLLSERCDTLVATSRAGKEAIDAIFNEAASLLAARYPALGGGTSEPSLRVATIPLGVDEKQNGGKDKELCRQLLGIAHNDIVLLYLGRLTEAAKADLEPLLVVFGRLLRATPNAHLMICGQDLSSYSDALRQYATSLGIGSALRIIPNVTPLLKPVLYGGADIFLSPVDTVQETFGLTLIEAMAAGLPVVASDWSGYKDIVEDGTTGFLIPTYWHLETAATAAEYGPIRQWIKNDHLIAQSTIVDMEAMYNRLSLLIADREMRRRFGEAGRKRVLSHYTWSRVIDRYRDLWLEQIDQCRSITSPVIPLNRPVVDYNAVFRHYATRTLQPSSLLMFNPATTTEDGTFHKRVLQIRDPEVAGQILRISQECEQAPRQLSQLVCDGTDTSLRAALWLLKKGFCRLCDSA
jgi:D-inositol-3-phosphate glycosyltransferase